MEPPIQTTTQPSYVLSLTVLLTNYPTIVLVTGIDRTNYYYSDSISLLGFYLIVFFLFVPPPSGPGHSIRSLDEVFSVFILLFLRSRLLLVKFRNFD